MLSSLFAAGGSHTCALEYEGPFYCWGWNSKGQLGDDTNTNRNIPTHNLLSDESIVKQVAAGESHTCVINDGDALYCRGSNSQGQLGDGTTVDKHIPTLIK